MLIDVINLNQKKQALILNKRYSRFYINTSMPFIALFLVGAKIVDLVCLVTLWGSSNNHISYSPICSPCGGL